MKQLVFFLSVALIICLHGAFQPVMQMPLTFDVVKENIVHENLMPSVTIHKRLAYQEEPCFIQRQKMTRIKKKNIKAMKEIGKRPVPNSPFHSNELSARAC